MAINFNIGQQLVGANAPCYIIAEIGSNHNQDLIKAKELIAAAKQAGANAAKFQALNFDKVHLSDKCNVKYKKLYEQISFCEDWYAPLAEYCKQQDIDFFSSVTYLEAVDLLVKYNAPCIKIASAQFDIFPEIVAKAASTGLPLIMSTGLSNYGGIEKTLALVKKTGNNKIILMHCITEYPAEIARINLKLIATYRQAFGCLVGYSDHSLSVAIPSAAVALGAVAIEKHLTLNRNATGPDHHFAIMPDEFAEMVTYIRQVEQALGTGIKQPLNTNEQLQRDAFLYKWVTDKPLKANEKICRAKLKLRRIEGGIERDAIDLLESFKSNIALDNNTKLEWKHLSYVEE